MRGMGREERGKSAERGGGGGASLGRHRSTAAWSWFYLHFISTPSVNLYFLWRSRAGRAGGGGGAGRQAAGEEKQAGSGGMLPACVAVASATRWEKRFMFIIDYFCLMMLILLHFSHLLHAAWEAEQETETERQRETMFPPACVCCTLHVAHCLPLHTKGSWEFQLALLLPQLSHKCCSCCCCCWQHFDLLRARLGNIVA